MDYIKVDKCQGLQDFNFSEAILGIKSKLFLVMLNVYYRKLLMITRLNNNLNFWNFHQKRVQNWILFIIATKAWLKITQNKFIKINAWLNSTKN